MSEQVDRSDTPRAARAALAFLLLLSPATAVRAQDHSHPLPAPPDAADHEAMMPGPLGIRQSREGSGTAWLPTLSPMYALHRSAGPWDLMLHGNAFLYYIDEGSRRGDEDFGSINWFMGMARRSIGRGELMLRSMLSLDPATVGECGYPDLLATGEFCDELGLLHDRQHPHDFFMELAAQYRREITDRLAFQLYGGLAAEPAIGPVAFPHRISAIANPIAPITHHWHDATHISFGVLTAGIFTRRWKLEGSLFNGREPDDERWNLDLNPLDSYAGRLWYASERWALQLSAAHLEEAEIHEIGDPREDVDRYTASATHHRPFRRRGIWATTAVWGRNVEAEANTDGVLVESMLDLDGRNLLFLTGEIVGKTGADLVLDVEALEDEVFTVGKFSVGYNRQFGPWADLLPGLGARLSLSFVPADLEPFYGAQTAFGWSVFASLRPRPMPAHAVHAMAPPAAPPPAAEPAPPGHPDVHDRTPAAHQDTPRALLSLAEVERAVAAEGVHLAASDTILQPFWTVPTAVYRIHGANTPHAALHVNVYPTVEAAEADAARIGPAGAIGTAMPTWVAPPHFFLARNALITLLADPARDPAVIAAVERAVRLLGGANITDHR